MGLFKKETSISRSMPDVKTINGIKITKVPVGRYVQLMKNMDDLPLLVMDACFPGEKIESVWEKLSNLSGEMLVAAVANMLAVIPERVLSMVSELIGIEENVIEELTPAELVEVLEAYWDVNDMSDFFNNARTLYKKMFARKTGSSDGSPSLNH